MKKKGKRVLAILLAAMMMTACASNKEVQNDTGKTIVTSSETQTENILHEDKEQNTDEEEADLKGTDVTFWYMPLYEGFDEKMSQDLAQEVKEKYGIILNTEVLTWDAGPEKVTVAMATGATPDLYLDTYSRIAPAIGAVYQQIYRILQMRLKTCYMMVYWIRES